MPNVRSYTRPSDGVHVRGHWRNLSSAATGSGIAGFLVAIAALAILGQVDGHSSAAPGSALAAPVSATSHASRLGAGGRIVQVSSHRDAGLADAEAAQLRRRGLPAGVLLSERYRPLQSGYRVVYVGPYPSTAAGEPLPPGSPPPCPEAWSAMSTLGDRRPMLWVQVAGGRRGWDGAATHGVVTP